MARTAPESSGEPQASTGELTRPASVRSSTEPTAPSALGRPSWIVFAIAAVVAVWVTADVVLRGPLTELDGAASDMFRGWGLREKPWPYNAVYVLTVFGTRAVIVLVFAPYVLAVSWLRKTIQPLLRFAVALAMLTITVYACKWTIGRTAPTVDLLRADGESYPSGHAPNSVLMWGLVCWLAIEYRLPERLIQALRLMRYVAPVFVVTGMLLLDFHWVSDMVAGVAMGVVLLGLLHLVFTGPRAQWGTWAGTRSSDSA